MAESRTSSDAPLAGRHALVTGAGRGIGAAVAGALAAAGARVTLLGRRRDTLDALMGRLPGAAHGAVLADVTDADAVTAAFADAQARSGPLDILVNNAGAAHTAPFARTTRDQWDAMLSVNLTAVFTCMQAALPGMVERGWGRIVNIASTAGLKPYPYVAAYVAAKHGVVGLTRAVALESARTGVTVNAVCPGYTDTDLISGALDRIQAKTGRDRAELLAEITRSNPQGRLIRPEEVADAVLWLCRPESDAITGQAIAVAGGEVM